MKRVLVVMMAVFAFTMLNQTIIYPQATAESSIKSALNNLLDYSKAKTYDKAVKLMLFEDQSKSDAEKASQAKRTCKKISALMDLSSKHEFGEFKITGETGKEIYTMQIVFISGDQKLVTSFSFVKKDNTYLLSNMN
jgi:hypothetical protein